MPDRGNWNRAARRSGGNRHFRILVGPADVFLAQASAIAMSLQIPLWRVVRKGLRMQEQASKSDGDAACDVDNEARLGDA